MRLNLVEQFMNIKKKEYQMCNVIEIYICRGGTLCPPVIYIGIYLKEYNLYLKRWNY